MRRRSIQLQSLSALFMMTRCLVTTYPVLAVVSNRYPRDLGRLPTCYSPVRHGFLKKASFLDSSVRLACIRHAASVHPEPGSNSPLFVCLFFSTLSFPASFLSLSGPRSVLLELTFPVWFSKIGLAFPQALVYITIPSLFVSTPFFIFSSFFYSDR